jgi:hypothetical protein
MLKNVKRYRCSSKPERSWVCLSTSMYAFDYVGCAWTVEPVFRLLRRVLVSRPYESILGSWAVEISKELWWYTELRGVGRDLRIPTEVRQPKLTSCTCLYPSMPASSSASALASVVLGIVVGIWYWTLGKRKGMDLSQCVFCRCQEGWSPFGGYAIP